MYCTVKETDTETNKKMNIQTLINRIQILEEKRDNGTITMTEESVLVKLTEIAEKYIKAI